MHHSGGRRLEGVDHVGGKNRISMKYTLLIKAIAA